MQVNSHLERTRNPDFILWTMGVYQAVLCSLLRVFRAVPLPPALTLPLPLNPTPPPASIHGDRARGFPEHLARGFDVRRTMATATGWRAPVSMATVSMRPLLSYLSSPSCQLTQLCVGYTDFFFFFFFFFFLYKRSYFITSRSVSPTTPPTQPLQTLRHAVHRQPSL